MIIMNVAKPSYEEYDLKGLTVKEACEKARGAGWEVSRVISVEDDDKTDCYNTSIIVTDYSYYEYNHSMTIYFGEKKTEEQKKAECEASGKWYRDSSCKSEEEWENDYAWENAHAACKKYGSSGYAKTLTDCYVGSEYKGPVDGALTTETQSNASTSSSSNSGSNSSWKQVLREYEAWMNDYVNFMKKYNNTSDTSSKLAMLEDYTRLASEMTSWTQKVENVKGDLSESDLVEYLQTINRVNQKLSELY
ncbi:PASTA domain-containing protein [Candidatus Saccharibacteria bacterium]|nr:PASTA domain-containing protein [Candidatus Saccharibacteria bacterium]